MAKYALYAELKAKPGKEAEVEAFIKQGGAMAQSEAGTVNWYGFKEDKPGVFGIFDTFNDEAGREAHLNGEIAKALMAKADQYFAERPTIAFTVPSASKWSRLYSEAISPQRANR